MTWRDLFSKPLFRTFAIGFATGAAAALIIGVWGLIFLGLLAFVVVEAIKASNRNKDKEGGSS